MLNQNTHKSRKHSAMLINDSVYQDPELGPWTLPRFRVCPNCNEQVAVIPRKKGVRVPVSGPAGTVPVEIVYRASCCSKCGKIICEREFDTQYAKQAPAQYKKITGQELPTLAPVDNRMIYLDHAATTRLDDEALSVMQQYYQIDYANPSTPYSFSETARAALNDARKTIADAIGADSPEEIIFTSGGTESDNTALKGIAFKELLKIPQQKGLDTGSKVGYHCHIITTAIEHHAVLRACQFLERIGCTVSYLPVTREGIVKPEVLANMLRHHPDTKLVSIMMANNEIGTIEPIQELAAIAHEHHALFHTDAVQAVGHIPIDVNAQGIDLLSASAHKFNGPKGVGFLYVRNGVDFEPLLHGGAQEADRRAGTENVPAIVGMAAALKRHNDRLVSTMGYLFSLQDKLVNCLRDHGVDFIINGGSNRLPGSLSLSIKGVEGVNLLRHLDLMNIEIAVGSACDSQSAQQSHVITAIDIPKDYIKGTIRITLGLDNTYEEMAYVAAQIADIVS